MVMGSWTWRRQKYLQGRELLVAPLEIARGRWAGEPPN
uniref:Uncharacterized protein n=1 Tax=Setaria italica TaxID=4555 RepID=K4A4D0_SETIT